MIAPSLPIPAELTGAEVEAASSRLLTPAAPRPSVTPHPAGMDLAMAATALGLARMQLLHATGRGPWLPGTLNLAVEIEVSLTALCEALEALTHRAATGAAQL